MLSAMFFVAWCIHTFNFIVTRGFRIRSQMQGRMMTTRMMRVPGRRKAVRMTDLTRRRTREKMMSDSDLISVLTLIAPERMEG